MPRRLAVLTLMLSASVAAAHAEKPAAGKPVQPYFDLQTMGLPAVVHKRLVNYVFVDVRLGLANGVDASKLQAQEPYLRDALVRAAAHTPFNPPEDGVRIDQARFKAEVMQVAAAQLGPGKVVSVTIRSQTPQHRTGVPGGGTS